MALPRRLFLDSLDRLVYLICTSIVEVTHLLLGAKLERGQEDEVVTWEQREEMHAFVELSCLTVWVS